MSVSYVDNPLTASSLEAVFANFEKARPENRDVWPALARLHPARTRVELFDMAWWMHFRSVQPVARPI
jgi:hypothetical protein